MTERLAGLDPDPLTVATYDAGWDAGYEQATRDGSPRFLAVVLVALVAGAVGFLLAWSIASPAAAAPRGASEPIPAARTLPGASSVAGQRRPAPPSVEPIRPAAVQRTGTASWYAAHGLIAAAGPALRHGDWRGSRVVVQAGGRSVVVVLADYCQCYGSRLIDLSDDAFARLAPLSRGLLRVTVTSPGPAPTTPPTDQEAQP